MEKFALRVLVIVLLGAAVGGYCMYRSKVMLHLPPPEVRNANNQKPVTTPPAAPTGVPAPTGAPASTGAAAVNPPPSNPQPSAPTAKTDSVEQYFISLDEAKKYYNDRATKNILFIDAREFIEYREGHISGALSLPKRRFDGALAKDTIENLKGNEMVVYCHGADCTDSEAVVKRLIALHLDMGPYHIIKDGYPGWEERNKTDPAGFPIDKGDR